MVKKFFLVWLGLIAVASALAQDGRTIRKVVVVGNAEISAAAITSAMRSAPGSVLSTPNLRADETTILNLGFFSKVAITPTNVGDTEVDLVVNVEEYPVIKEIRIVGNTVISTEKIREIVEAHQPVGQIWNNRNALAINTEVRALYEKEGYFAQFEQLGPMAESPNTLNIQLLEATVGDIKLVGLTRTKPRTIRRIMETQPGQAFNIEQFRKDMQELYSTYWFEELTPERQVTEDPSVFDFVINFKEARTAQLNAGIALDPQSRLVGTLSYSDSNFRGNGQSVGVQLSQATVGGGPSAELAYTDRFFDDLDTRISASVFSKVIYNFTGNGVFGQSGDVNNAFNERQTGFNITFTRPVSETVRASVGLLARNSRTINLDITNNNNNTTEFIQQDGDLIRLLLGAEYSTAFPLTEPFQGQAASIVLEPGYSNITKVGGNLSQFNNLLGSSIFVKTNFEYRQYWSKAPKEQNPDDIGLAKPRPVVAFRAQYGIVNGTVPFFEQQFVGGSNSLRGYPNQRFWGNQSFLATLEYRHPVQRSFNLIGFVDYGGAWGGYGELNDFTQSDSPFFKLGYGAGLSFRTPLGPIRIDFAWNQDGGSRTHFSFGTSF